MERKYSPVSRRPVEIASPGRFLEDDDTKDEATLVSFDAILPNDLLERVFSFLPIASVIRSGSVCKRWCDIIQSGRRSWSEMPPQKPWYFMFTCRESVIGGHAYDPSFRKWCNFEIPGFENRNWLTSASRGLVCFMDGDYQSHVFVCNPVTRHWKRLQDAPAGKSPDYSAIAISVNSRSQCYKIAVVRSKHAPEDDFFNWEFSIQIYESETRSWVTAVDEMLIGWRGSTESVICNGVLYCLIHCTRVLGATQPCYNLMAYDLSVLPSPLSRKVIPVPYTLTCARLMNLKDRLIMVGGIGKNNRIQVIKGIVIWELHKQEWREVTRMPHKFFQGFGEFDEVFASSGAGDLVYIQSYGSPALLVFDMSRKLWKWSVKCPMIKRFPLQLFTGFCFEPRLGIDS